MRRVLVAAAITACAGTAVFSGETAAPSGGLRYTITVSRFENRANWSGSWNLGDAWGTVLTDMLNQSGRFIVLGESDMRNEALAEQDFAASGRVAGGAKAPATGQMTPAQLLVKGAITHVQMDTGGKGGGLRIKGFRIGGRGQKAEINATIYVVDSTTGQVIASTNVVGKAEKKGIKLGFDTSRWGAAFGGHENDNLGLAVQDACAKAVQFIIDQLPNVAWTGTVAAVRGDKVYVNRGQREGVRPGMEFVVGQRDVIRDPDTGEILDEEVIEVARLRVDRVKEKVSICSVVSGDAAKVTKGMAVHLP
ncbi:MAG: hypothetical protein D6718_12990 [Acidobacteria bacterium]|nr:MAG: hypothetical protein D6718_12990 [Acidobacteriota bacterium]